MVAKTARYALAAWLSLLLATALYFRLRDLGTVPGINGDEAWFGVQMQELLAGRPVALQTPTGLPLNPFLTGPLAFLLLLFEPSFWILRAVSAVAGILTVVLAYRLGSKALDRRTGTIAALLLCFLPIMIAYSRMGWDPSMVPLFSVLALYYALQGRAVGLTTSLACAILVHATAVFLVPMAGVVYVTALFKRRDDIKLSTRKAIAVGLSAAAVAAAVAAQFFSSYPPSFGRLLKPHELLTFAANYTSMLSGVSAYTFFATSMGEQTAVFRDMATCVGLVILAVPGLWILVRKREWERLSLMAGLALSALAMIATAGPSAISPYTERYGMFFLAPSAMVLASLLSALPGDDGRSWESSRARWLLAGVLVLGTFLLADFHRHYFQPLRSGSVEPHVGFRTASVEPKLQAFAVVMKDRERKGSPPPPSLSMEGWWLFWPLKFLGAGEGFSDMRMLSNERPPEGKDREDLLSALDAGGYAVGFDGGPLEEFMRDEFEPNRYRLTSVRDAAGRKLIHVYWMKSAEETSAPAASKMTPP